MNDVDRWVNHEGPEPAGIEELMDGARAAHRRTPEQVERMRRSFLEALDAQQRKEAAERKAKRRPAARLVALLAAPGLAAVIGVAAMVARGGPMLEGASTEAQPVQGPAGEATVAAMAEPTTHAPAGVEPGADAGAPRGTGTGAPRRQGVHPWR